ncbi:hypothetical protein BS78_04G131800 [Paspalum vaginatum]|nr:hypothetical protein BS78_04G131800 [Paspalum vaginatum]
MASTAVHVETGANHHRLAPTPAAAGALEVVIDVSSSDTESDDPGGGSEKRPWRSAGRVSGGDRDKKKARILAAAATVPAGFMDPLPPARSLPLPQPALAPERSVTKQFWKAGDYDGKPHMLAVEAAQHSDSGMEHVRVHPKFLHSNATSHKWALGAFAELLDNSLDEVMNGATYVNIDMVENKKDQTRMLLIEDNGGGMNPDKMRHCMSLGYSVKSKVKNTIGQYGNGFKTSTMRLGADVLVFSRSRGIEGTRPTQSIGMLSYTFLRSTNKQDIIVPMVDYEKEQEWKRKVRTTLTDWCTSLETIIQWSPYSTEAELIHEFDSIGEQGTRIIIYNLWEDDAGELELDFDADSNDIQIRGVNRDQKKIQKANQFPNSKHFFTYRHSLRSYASILYLLLPDSFRMILRGREIEHHNVVNDLMLKKQLNYKPADTDMAAKVTIGFVKDARHHIDIQGFNVYHKNRLIKPFWRVWTAAGSGGRGIIGVLEVNFVEPAHDKQDFERTNCLARLEARLNRIQKQYWSDNHHRIGYGTNDSGTDVGTGKRGISPHPFGKCARKSNYLQTINSTDRSCSELTNKNKNANMSSQRMTMRSASDREFSSRTVSQQKAEKSSNTTTPERSVMDGLSNTGDRITEIGGTQSRSTSPILRTPEKYFCNVNTSLPSPSPSGVKRSERIAARYQTKEANALKNQDGQSIVDPEAVIKQLKEENSSLKERILMVEESLSRELQIKQDKNKSLIEREASCTIQDLMEQLNAVRNCHKR